MKKENSGKLNLVLLAMVGLFTLGTFIVSSLALLKVDQPIMGGFASSLSNQFFTTTPTATTTHASLPVKLLDKNRNRLYAVIVNDSDTDIYIHLNAFDNTVAASTTVNVNTGIRINANGGNYELLPENNYVGEVWATSTASGKNILILEK